MSRPAFYLLFFAILAFFAPRHAYAESWGLPFTVSAPVTDAAFSGFSFESGFAMRNNYGGFGAIPGNIAFPAYACFDPDHDGFGVVTRLVQLQSYYSDYVLFRGYRSNISCSHGQPSTAFFLADLASGYYSDPPQPTENEADPGWCIAGKKLPSLVPSDRVVDGDLRTDEDGKCDLKLNAAECGPEVNGSRLCYLEVIGLVQPEGPDLPAEAPGQPLRIEITNPALTDPDSPAFASGQPEEPLVDDCGDGELFQWAGGMICSNQLVAGGGVQVQVDPPSGSQQGYYHPGNYDSSGNYIGAFDRDWQGPTSYAPEKAWNWGSTPASQTPADQLERLNSSGGVIRVASGDGSVFPPGYSGDTSATAPSTDPDTGEVDSGTSDGDPKAPKSGFYTRRFPGGIQGVWDAHKDDLGQSDTVRFVRQFSDIQLPAVSAGAVCWAFDWRKMPLVGAAWAQNPDLARGICVEEWEITLLRLLFLIATISYCRSLIFGG